MTIEKEKAKEEYRKQRTEDGTKNTEQRTQKSEENTGSRIRENDMSATYTITIPEWLDRIFTRPLMIYRKLKYGYTFRRIPLGYGVYTIVDEDVFYRLSHYKWFLKGCNSKKFYAARHIKTGSGCTKLLNMHREIMNEPKGFLVDHLDGNSLDNRRANLREATRSQNCQNVPKKKNTSSRFIGVNYSKEERKYRARISLNEKRIYLGRFDNEIDAAKAYDVAARKYYGEHAKVNFPEETEAVLAGLQIEKITGVG